MNILLDNKLIQFGSDDFPILISGIEGSGSSFFSVCLMVNSFKQGHKILFFSAFPMAKDDFVKQLSEEEIKEVEFVETGDEIIGKRAVIIKNGDEESFIKVISSLKDIDERVILVKNIDEYGDKLFEVIKDKKLLVLSGDLDKCSFADKIVGEDFKTKIYFSNPINYPVANFIELEKYQGMIVSNRYNGVINLQNEK